MSDEVFEAMLMKQWPDYWRHNQHLKVYRLWNGACFNAPNQPVVGVNWYEARAYCVWLSAQTGQCFRLPTEVEWEAAAGGREGRLFPWGNSFDEMRCNTKKTKLHCTTPVGVFPSGNTPSLTMQHGVSDLSGNVYEWTSSCHMSYPYRNDDGRENTNLDTEPPVVRGGSFGLDLMHARSSSRTYCFPDNPRSESIGFRVLCSLTH